MKLQVIDAHGRLFGRVNLIDFGICLLLGLLVFSLIVPLVRIMNKTVSESPGVDKTTVLLTVRYDSLPSSVVKAVKEGAVQRDADGRVVTTLTKILEARPIRLMLSMPIDGYMEMVVQFKIQAYRVNETGFYYFHDGRKTARPSTTNRLALGELFTFFQPMYTLAGVVVGIQPVDEKGSQSPGP